MCYSPKVRCAEFLSAELRKINKEFAHASTHEEKKNISLRLNSLQAEYDGTPERAKMLREDASRTDNKQERSRKLGYISVCEQGYHHRLAEAEKQIALVNNKAIDSLMKNKPVVPEFLYPVQATLLGNEELVYDASFTKVH